MNKICELLKSKRGVALEMAISTMLIVFALCISLLTVAELMQKNSIDEVSRIDSTVELDKIGEDFFSAHKNGLTFSEQSYPDYEITTSQHVGEDGDVYCLLVKGSNSSITLSVNVTVESDVTRISLWKYSRL